MDELTEITIEYEKMNKEKSKAAQGQLSELRAKLAAYESTDYARRIAAAEKLAERIELFKSLSGLWDGDDEAALDEWKAANKGECQHERGIVTNYRSYPATREQPSEKTGLVTCRECGEVWPLGYEPSDMDLSIER